MPMQDERTFELSQKIARERDRLAAALVPVRTSAQTIERKVNAVRYIATHPVSLLVAVAVILIVRPRGMGKWLRRAWLAYGAVKALKPALRLEGPNSRPQQSDKV